jgi:hypothetical protein
LCRSRAFPPMGLWSYYFWAVRRGPTRRSAIAIPIPFEPKQERICFAPKAQHSAPAWGSAPGLMAPTARALKARFTIGLLRRHGVISTSGMFWVGNPSAGLSRAFSAWFIGLSDSWGDAPGSHETAPLALE